MAVRRRPHDIPLEGGGPVFRRVYLMAFGVAALIGLTIGVIWVVAGLVNFYFLQ